MFFVEHEPFFPANQQTNNDYPTTQDHYFFPEFLPKPHVISSGGDTDEGEEVTPKENEGEEDQQGKEECLKD